MGKLTVTNEGGVNHITGDFSELGGDSWRAEVYDRGELVTVFEGQGSVAGGNTVVIWPVSTAISQSKYGEASLIYRFDSDTEIQIEGKGVIGDEVRLVSQGGAGYDFINSYSLDGRNVTDLTLTDNSIGRK